MKQRWGLDRKNVLRQTPGDHWGANQHHWNTGEKKKKKKKKKTEKKQQKKKKTVEPQGYPKAKKSSMTNSKVDT